MDCLQIVGCIWGVVLIWCLWESYISPIYPSNYNEDGINNDYTEIDEKDDEI
jgi:hypothetical protein|tara:strand:+ start:1653 stop:1808 length:156 start_codon:yes stop_codon:yes gene_type:complete